MGKVTKGRPWISAPARRMIDGVLSRKQLLQFPNTSVQLFNMLTTITTFSIYSLAGSRYSYFDSMPPGGDWSAGRES